MFDLIRGGLSTYYGGGTKTIEQFSLRNSVHFRMIKKWQASRRIKLFVCFVERLKQSCSLSIFFELFSLQLKLFNSEQYLLYFPGFSQVKQRDLCLLKKNEIFK